jgi:hypothetical protein
LTMYFHLACLFFSVSISQGRNKPLIKKSQNIQVVHENLYILGFNATSNNNQYYANSHYFHQFPPGY